MFLCFKTPYLSFEDKKQISRTNFKIQKSIKLKCNISKEYKARRYDWIDGYWRGYDLTL